MKKSNIIYLLIILLAFSACEKTKVDIKRYGSLTGVVVDGETYEPIEGVLVSTNPASSSVISSNTGEFSFNKILTGEVTVTAKKKNYLSNNIIVSVYENEKTQMNVVLTKDDKNYGSVTIYDPVPGNGAVDQLSSFMMQWNVDQTRPDIELKYDVYLFESNSTTQTVIGESLLGKEAVVDGLKDNTTYYWYVVAKYDGNIVSNGPTWSFKTGNNSTN
ncbi:MAG TPA: carboxypeptidase regulatory-like domain-containing protein [Sunxiuqinia sp.]|nr:carboxypeptidase regulatory-like domain-containing protein [Sunxiuqinia sp.]